LLTKFNNEIEVDGRVVGINRIVGKSSLQSTKPSFLSDLIFISFGSAVSAFMLTLSIPNRDVFGIILGIFEFLVTAFGIYATYEKINKKRRFN
jgi:hypothetical protein